MDKFQISVFFVLLTSLIQAQKSEIYTNNLSDYNRANQLYQNKDYYAAQIVFKKIKNDFEDTSELKARASYYEAFCAIKLGQVNGEDLMKDFVKKYPTSTKRNNAFLEVGEYYFNNGNYPYALKWYTQVNRESLNLNSREEFNFKFAYGLFATGNYTKSKQYFSQLLNSPKYGSEAKYYYGYMAYKDDDFDDADKYLSSVDDKKLGKDIPYFMANIKFKTGKFEETIQTAVPLYEKSNGIQKSELAKIIGESYFNLEEYENAIPYLTNYQGKKGKWNNTDYYLLGYAYYKQNDYEGALEWFTKIIDGNNAVSQNAYYHLGECYLKTDKKTEALNAFKNASQMDYDPNIQQDAWFNYAKLSYDIGNPYKSTVDVIKEYLEKYPTHLNKDELNNLLISSYFSSNDYEGALEYLKGDENDENYQKAAFLNGVHYFDNQKFDNAITYFKLAQNQNNTLSSKALFWEAESLYRLGNYDQALELFFEFSKNAEAKNTVEFDQIDYNIGYTYFKLKDYNSSGGHFRQFINSNNSDRQLIIDANMRLGDSYFALSNYFKAINPYNQVIDANDINVDYAQFQIALCHGFMGENEKKISELNQFLKYNLKSDLRDDALYELGNTYVNTNNNQKALSSFDELISNYPNSNYVPKALLRQGLIFYNSDLNNDALTTYKKVLTDYPNSQEAKEAVANARQIYIDLGKVDEYERLVNKLDFVNVSADDIEKTLFESAEKQYLNSNYSKAIDGLEKYLDRYPNSSNSLISLYYLAESYQQTDDKKKAANTYQSIIEKGRNEYSENALLKLSEYHLENDNWELAMDLLKRLEIESESKINKIYAQSNLMKGYYELKNYTKAQTYAEELLNQEKIEKHIISDAKLILARTAIENKEFEKAKETYKELENSSNSESIKAEALYYNAYFKHIDGNYKNSNIIIQKIASEYSNQRLWGSKALLIMSKNFYELQDNYQATYILENIIKNFNEFPEVTEEAKIDLQKIKKEVARTNESVIQEN